MKIPTRSFAVVALATSLAAAEPHGIPYMSLGNLDTSLVTNTVDRPTLDWAIEHPKTLGDIVSVNPTSGSLTTLTALRVRMNVVGIARNSLSLRDAASLWVILGSGNPWNEVFQESIQTLQIQHPVLNTTVPASTTIDLGGRILTTKVGEAWSPFRSTGTADTRVAVRRNGEVAPLPVHHAARHFLSAFLSYDETGIPTLKLGPMDALVFFELSASDPEENDFDLQDLVVLVSFEKA